MITLPKNETARVLAGRQTMTIQTGQGRWRLGGRPHPVQRGAYGEIVAHARLLAVARVRLASLTDEDAQLCGCTSLRILKDEWRQQRGRWFGGLEVWAIRFTLTGRPERSTQLTLFTEEVKHSG